MRDFDTRVEQERARVGHHRFKIFRHARRPELGEGPGGARHWGGRGVPFPGPEPPSVVVKIETVSYTHLRAHETGAYL
eukprot:3457323-Pyramimonas_sp.AAC.1